MIIVKGISPGLKKKDYFPPYSSCSLDFPPERAEICVQRKATLK